MLRDSRAVTVTPILSLDFLVDNSSEITLLSPPHWAMKDIIPFSDLCLTLSLKWLVLYINWALFAPDLQICDQWALIWWKLENLKSLVIIMFFFLNFILCFLGFFLLHIHPHAMCMSGVCSGQKRESDVLELELQVIASHTMDARNWTSGKIGSALKCSANSSAPHDLFIIPVNKLLFGKGGCV